MKTTHISIYCFIISVIVTGCATPGYLVDRGRDAADVFTATLSFGEGVASGRVGPIAGGLQSACDVFGLRGGRIGTKFNLREPESLYVRALCFGFEGLYGDDLMPRGKNYTALTGFVHRDNTNDIVIPFLSIPHEANYKNNSIHWAYMTQIEINATCVLGLRLGVNPGELVDFFLGWTTFDIFNDDLEQRKTIQK